MTWERLYRGQVSPGSMDEDRDKLLYKTAPSRLIFAHLYFVAFLLAGISAALSFGFLDVDLPTFLGRDLDLYGPLALAVLGLLIFIYAELKRIMRRYMVFESRVARREGILSKRIQYMPYNKVERVVLNQSIIKRIFGLGDIIVDTGEDSIVLAAVRRPGKVESLLAERVNAFGYPSPSASRDASYLRESR